MIRRNVGALLLTIAVLMQAAPAYADTVSFNDARGDAPERFDLTRTSVSNGQGRIVIKQRVRALQGRGSQIFGFAALAGSETVSIHTVRRGNGAVSVRVADGTECAGLRAQWLIKKSQIQISMPRDCVDRQGAIRVHTYIGAGDGSAGDPADWTKTVRVGQS